jgi:hypothetical protein
VSEDQSRALSEAGVARPTEYHGNTNDLIALTAAITGLTFCGYLTTNGLVCCLPVALGAAGLFLAKDAADPRRARTLSIIGIGSAAIVLLFLAACIALYVGMFIVLGLAGTAAFNPRFQ